MGVQTKISLIEVRALFPAFTINKLVPTANGVMDTTYILDDFVLKKYEREIEAKIETDTQRLEFFKKNGLHVTHLVASNQGWYLYEKLQGKLPHTTTYFHIQALARFVAKLHQLSAQEKTPFLQEYDVAMLLKKTKKQFFYYYKQLDSLHIYQQKCEGFIHGDIFKDNTLFDGEKIAVFDFIDGGCGEFSFDCAVALMAFNPKNKPSLEKLFMQTYNQHAPRKLKAQTLQTQIKLARKIYALLRIEKYGNVFGAKELLTNLKK